MRSTPLQVLILIALAVVACAGQTKEHEAERPVGPVDQQLEEPSPLAKLMRVMERHADEVKAGLATGAELPPFPEGIADITTATPTEGMHIDPISYPVFAKDYQAKVQALYDAPIEDRSAAYHALVQSCANCHRSHCPGPLMKIDKMYVEVER